VQQQIIHRGINADNWAKWHSVGQRLTTKIAGCTSHSTQSGSFWRSSSQQSVGLVLKKLHVNQRQEAQLLLRDCAMLACQLKSCQLLNDYATPNENRSRVSLTAFVKVHSHRRDWNELKWASSEHAERYKLTAHFIYIIVMRNGLKVNGCHYKHNRRSRLRPYIVDNSKPISLCQCTVVVIVDRGGRTQISSGSASEPETVHW